MRNIFCQSLIDYAERPEFIFLTGDLGYGALEPLRDRMGSRFINAGVAEQNMVSLAAGLSKSGLRPWTYSIAPFQYARPFEQIRNDVCFHQLPVVMVGNGGGYAYGVMGATHHAIEDYGTLLTLSGLDVYIPTFDADLPILVQELFETTQPTYLRLGYQEQPSDWTVPPFAAWRKLLSGEGPTAIVVGPLAGGCWKAWASLPLEIRPNLWCVSRMPVSKTPDELWNDLKSAKSVGIAEEHVAHGSFGSIFTGMMIQKHCLPPRFRHFTALGYPSQRYGSQRFHREESGLTPERILQELLANT